MLNVLVIDDNTDMTASLEMLLRLWGCDVLCANDGPSGLALANEYQADLILLDISMPEMSGYEVARQLRALAGGKGALLVAMSGLTDEKFRQQASESGFDIYLTKPGCGDELKQVLTFATLRHRAQDSAARLATVLTCC